MRPTVDHVATKLTACSMAVALVAVMACGRSAPTTDEDVTEKINVVTTVYPVTYFTSRIGGERISLTSLVSAGAEAHDFEPKPSDLRAIKEADVVVYIHPAFEAWMAAAIESIEPGKVIVQAADLSEEADAPEISGGEHDHGGVDPHVWLNPEEASGMVAKIRDGLVRADSTHREAYESNAAALVAQLAELGSQIVAALRACKLETVVVSHLAYGHLLEDYNIEQIGLAGLDAEVSETGPRTISEVVNRMKAEGIEHILVEPILDSALALQVTAETGATVLPLSPLENLTSAEIAAGDDYFTVMSRNLESLQTALRCAR